MKTLSKQITSSFYSLSSYEELKTDWAEHCQTSQVTTSELMLYQILRGKDWTKMFTPITNKVKLENGQRPWQIISTVTFSDLLRGNSFFKYFNTPEVLEFLTTRVNFSYRGESDGYLD